MNNLELEITSKAYNDMEMISEFIAQDNKSAASKMMRLFYKTFETFLKTPEYWYFKTGFYVYGRKILCCQKELFNCV